MEERARASIRISPEIPYKILREGRLRALTGFEAEEAIEQRDFFNDEGKEG
jgi:hypothetical protein